MGDCPLTKDNFQPLDIGQIHRDRAMVEHPCDECQPIDHVEAAALRKHIDRSRAMGDQCTCTQPFGHAKSCSRYAEVVSREHGAGGTAMGEPLTDRQRECIENDDRQRMMMSCLGYHRKLAEAIVKSLKDEGFVIDMAGCWAEYIAAVLSAERVVDPEEYDKAIKRWQDDSAYHQQEVERLRVKVAALEDTLRSTGDSG